LRCCARSEASCRCYPSPAFGFFRIVSLLCVVLPAWAAAENTRHAVRLSGRVIDATTSKPIPYATIYIHTLLLGAAADANGMFSAPVSAGETYRITVSYLGYQPRDTVVVAKDGAALTIALQPRSLALSEVIVWATEGTKNPSSSHIGKEALVHVQPSSFADVMQLLPGHLITDVKLESATFITMRQAGADANTSLGTAFLVDDVPLSVDATMQDVYNSSDNVLSSRSTTSQGVDMRKISTDRIEQVEVIRGIPSVEHGNLTSGVVKIETVSGKTPWESRAKIDLTNKLFSVGKGFALLRNSGTLNADVDYLDYQPDPRNVLTSYRRVTFSSRYKNRLEVTDNASFLLKANAAYTGSFDNEKKDPERMQGDESFSVAYNNVALSSSGELKLRQAFVSEVKYSASASYTSDATRRTRIVVGYNRPLPSATSEIEHYASYLPAVYTSTLRVDDRPLSLYANVQARANPTLGFLRQHLLLGVDWRRDANIGKGELYDLTRPPYPGTSSSTRPRPYNDVPALQQLALYAEDEATLPLRAWRINMRMGLRATTLPQQPSSYQMAGRWYVEPRVNIDVRLPQLSLFGRTGLLSFNLGYGKHYKFPTQAQLYPSKIYFDYIQLNYYSQQEALRTLHVQTRVQDPASYAIQPALNVKYEAGMQLELGDVNVSITVFDERMDNGFASAATPVKHEFKDYNESDVPSTGIIVAPKVEDFSFDPSTFVTSYYKVYNTSQVHKKGVEYQLSLGRIRPIYTAIRLAGAWFHTSYRSIGWRYSKPTVVINGEQYPYMGVYTWNNNDKVRQQLNTNLYFETHIPTLRMLFTTSVQNVWLVSTQQYRNNGLPVGYIDNDGKYHEFTESDAQKSIMVHLTEKYNALSFDIDKVPVQSTLNLKLTKEIGDALRVSFYVNRLLSYAPDYISRYGTTVVRTTQPSFGAEVCVKIR
jgi:hypothetical protein